MPRSKEPPGIWFIFAAGACFAAAAVLSSFGREILEWVALMAALVCLGMAWRMATARVRALEIEVAGLLSVLDGAAAQAREEKARGVPRPGP
jgi:Flp pilus assembly protein TadB